MPRNYGPKQIRSARVLYDFHCLNISALACLFAVEPPSPRQRCTCRIYHLQGFIPLLRSGWGGRGVGLRWVQGNSTRGQPRLPPSLSSSFNRNYKENNLPFFSTAFLSCQQKVADVICIYNQFCLTDLFVLLDLRLIDPVLCWMSFTQHKYMKADLFYYYRHMRICGNYKDC